MVRKKGKGNSFRTLCLLKGMHLSALSQPEVDLRINIMNKRDLRIKKEGFHALNSFVFFITVIMKCHIICYCT